MTSELGHIVTNRRKFVLSNLLGAASVAGAATLARMSAAQASQNGQGQNGQGQNGQGQNGQGQNGQGQNGQGQNGQGPNCFLKGTKVRTVDGERAVETLSSGDMLPTEFGGARPIQWLGRYHVRRSDSLRLWEEARPVRIARSAIGPNVPHSDLFVTYTHALFIDGSLVHAGSLINGRTVAFCDAEGVDELEYFHIKLKTHNVIYANGVGCETLLPVGQGRADLDDYPYLFESTAVDERPCVAILSYKGARSKITSRIRSAISPWIDRREKIDVIRDRLEARAALCRRG
jgi:hypothetical protein